MYLQSHLKSVESLVEDKQNKELADIKQSTNTLMRISWHVVAKLFIVNKMFKRDHQNKVSPNIWEK